MEGLSRLAVITAHPDDETFGPGGTLARLSRGGAEILLLVASRGERGRFGEVPLSSAEELGRVREEELAHAARALGIRRVVILGWPDGGVAALPRDEALKAVLGKLEGFSPQAVLTFPPGGISGHPDHRAVSLLGSLAARRLGTGLYYFTLPLELLERAFGKPFHPLDARASLRVDVSPFLDRKAQAINFYRTQSFSVRRVFGSFPVREEELPREEFFLEVLPPRIRAISPPG
jgi:LmbE family N-acetylglucosaminyl deacetylase